MNIPFETQAAEGSGIQSNSAVVTRQMDSREAADAGLLLWRENFFIFLPFFAIPFWICAFALRMLPGTAQYFSWLILWLLKPFFDRIILHIISVRFFEPSADMDRLFRGMGKSICRGLLGDLLWRRFSPLRAAMMPVRVIEPQKKSGKEIAERRKLLENGGLGYCFLLTLWGIAVEAALLIGEILFVTVMVDLIGGDLFSISGNSEIFIFSAWCINYILVETLYVCMGFRVYINSRINVEGWDIEIMFRGFAEKLKKKKAGGTLIILCLICLFLPARASAADWETTLGGDVPYETLRNILDSPEFGGEKDSWGIRFKKPYEPSDIPEININPVTERLREIFAFVLRFILIILIGTFAVFLLLFVHNLVYKKNYSLNKQAVTAMDGIPPGNPQMFLEKAIVFFEQGNLRMAWGYCAAAAILSWQLYRGISFPSNATENECACLVMSEANLTGKVGLQEAKAFHKLINHWINFAYAGQLPPQECFEEAVVFCRSLVPNSAGEK